MHLLLLLLTLNLLLNHCLAVSSSQHDSLPGSSTSNIGNANATPGNQQKNGLSKPKRTYRAFNEQQTQVLQKQFEKNPYPNEEKIKELAKKLELNEIQTNNWFNRKRHEAKQKESQLNTDGSLNQEDLSKHKRTYHALNEQQRKVLQKEFEKNPYPNKKKKKELIEENGLNEKQISRWFANKRMEYKNQSKLNVDGSLNQEDLSKLENPPNRFNKKQNAVLLQAYETYKNYKLVPEIKEKIAKEAEVTVTQVKDYFFNEKRRRKMAEKEGKSNVDNNLSQEDVDKSNQKQHIRQLLLNAFNTGQEVAAAVRDICRLYGEGAMFEGTAYYWYHKFKNGNVDLRDNRGRISKFDEDKLQALLKENGRQTLWELAEKMGCTSQTIINHLKSMGFTQKSGAWVPHELNEKQKEKQVLSLNESNPTQGTNLSSSQSKRHSSSLEQQNLPYNTNEQISQPNRSASRDEKQKQLKRKDIRNFDLNATPEQEISETEKRKRIAFKDLDLNVSPEREMSE